MGNNPVYTMLLNFTLAGVAGAYAGRTFSQTHSGQSALLGATLAMVIYGAAKERVSA